MAEVTAGRLLLVAVEFPPLGGGGVLRMTKLVKYLARQGWEITVVCSDEEPPFAGDPSLLRDIPPSVVVRRVRGPFRSMGSGAGAVAVAGARNRFLAWPTRLAKAVSRSFLVPDRWIGWAWRVGRMDLGEFRPQVVLSSGPPHSAHIAGKRIATRLGIPHVIDLRDDWSANPLHRSVLPWHDPLDAAIERRTIRSAAGVVVVSEAAREDYGRLHPALWARITAIPNGFDPEDVPALESKARTGESLAYLHAGSLRNNRRNAGPFLAAFGRRAATHDIALELLGPISPEHAQMARAGIPAPSLRIEGSVEHAAAIERMRAADVLVVITSEAEAGNATMTGKIFEYLAVRRPILLIAPPGPAAELIRETGGGVVADPADGLSIEQAMVAVEALARSETFRGADPALLARYDRRALASRWSDLVAATITADSRS